MAPPLRLLAAVEKHGLEGMVSKRIEAPYRLGSRSGWVKMKTAAWRAANQGRLEAIRNSLDADHLPTSGAQRTLASSRVQALIRKAR